jgi:8-oxo-dGTP diphosphatase
LPPGDRLPHRDAHRRIDAGHTDVSLWFVVKVGREQPPSLDYNEFREARWWSPAEIRASDASRFDPHLPRFVSKIERAS